MKYEQWDYFDPSDASCGLPCTVDGCREDHPTGTFEIDGPDWDPNFERPRVLVEEHARLLAAAPALAVAWASVPEDVRSLVMLRLPEWAIHDVRAVMAADAPPAGGAQ